MKQEKQATAVMVFKERKTEDQRLVNGEFAFRTRIGRLGVPPNHLVAIPACWSSPNSASFRVEARRTVQVDPSLLARSEAVTERTQPTMGDSRKARGHRAACLNLVPCRLFILKCSIEIGYPTLHKM